MSELQDTIKSNGLANLKKGDKVLNQRILMKQRNTLMKLYL